MFQERIINIYNDDQYPALKGIKLWFSRKFVELNNNIFSQAPVCGVTE